MSKIIENPKSYKGRELTDIFFRPMLTGADAQALGIRVMYDVPVPTTLNFWKRAGDVLKQYAKGFQGGDLAEKFQKTISLSRVKAEMSYSASDYFNMVWEQLVQDSSVNLQNLSGTEVEKAETALFKESIAESIRRTMWLGDKARTGVYDSFDGFLKTLLADSKGTGEVVPCVELPDMTDPDGVISLFKSMWDEAPQVLKALKPQGNLVYLVTDDIYLAYEDYLNTQTLESSFKAMQDGRKELAYNGIPVKSVGLAGVIEDIADLPDSFALLTDSRNLALAVNTKDMPSAEVAMWYNPDEMENRQRAVFMAGTEYLLPELVVMSVPTDFMPVP